MSRRASHYSKLMINYMCNYNNNNDNVNDSNNGATPRGVAGRNNDRERVNYRLRREGIVAGKKATNPTKRELPFTVCERSDELRPGRKEWRE